MEEVAEVVHLKPAVWTSCQARLSGDDPTPWRHHVMERPPLEPIVTAYRWHQ
jgi:hypothetical protein